MAEVGGAAGPRSILEISAARRISCVFTAPATVACDSAPAVMRSTKCAIWGTKGRRSTEPLPGHEWQWLDAIKPRVEPDCRVVYHYKADRAITLEGIANQPGRSVRWDPVKEQIAGDKEAQRLARPVYRRRREFPAEYV